MSWARRYPLLTAILGLTAAGAIALAVLVFMAWSGYSEISTEYDEADRQLKLLESARVYPSAGNVEILEEQRDQYAREFAELRDNLETLQIPVEPISPSGFLDKLRETVSEMEQLAEDNGVSLADDFYMGFPEYRATPPRPEAAPELSRQLDTVRLVVERLMDLGIVELTFIRRDPLPSELGETVPGRDAPPAPPASPGAVVAEEELIEKQTMDFGFVTTPVSFREAVNAVASAKSFVILRTLRVRNEQTEGPSKADTLADRNGGAGGPGIDAPVGGDGGTRRMQFVVGRENLDAALRLQIVNFVPEGEATGEAE